MNLMSRILLHHGEGCDFVVANSKLIFMERSFEGHDYGDILRSDCKYLILFYEQEQIFMLNMLCI